MFMFSGYFAHFQCISSNSHSKLLLTTECCTLFFSRAKKKYLSVVLMIGACDLFELEVSFLINVTDNITVKE